MFVVSSLPCSERFFSPSIPVFPSVQNPTLPNSNSIWTARARLNEFLGKQIRILKGQYSRGVASLKPVNLIRDLFVFRNMLSCLHCNLTSLLSFEGCCSQERETCSSRSRALGTNGEVKCETSSAQRGLLLLYYILPVWSNPPCWSNIIHSFWPIIVRWYWIRLIGLMVLCQTISKTVQQRPRSDGTVLDEVDECRDLILLLFGVLKLSVFITTVLRLSAIRD